MNSYQSNFSPYILKKQNYNIIEKVNSYMIDIVCSGGYISIVFNALGIIYDGLLPIISLVSVVISLSCCIFLTKFYAFKFNIKSIMLLLLIIFWFLISYLRFDSFNYINSYFIQFLFYGGVIFILLSIPYSYKKIVFGMSVISLLILINPISIVNNIISTSFVEYSMIPMGTSYSILPSVVASIIYFLYYKSRDDGYLVKISYLINFFLLILLIFEANRGISVALLILLYTIWFSGFKKRTYRRTRLTFAYLSIFLLTIGVLNIEQVLVMTNNFLQKMGIEIATISKSVYKIQTAGLLNGRDDVYHNAWDLILYNPLFGSGISSYAYHYDGFYPHNIILQLLLEFGIIFSIPFFILLLKSLLISFISLKDDNKYNEFKVFIIFCFVCSIPRLMLSSYFWQDQMFWLMLFSLTKFNVLKRTSKDKIL